MSRAEEFVTNFPDLQNYRAKASGNRAVIKKTGITGLLGSLPYFIIAALSLAAVSHFGLIEALNRPVLKYLGYAAGAIVLVAGIIYRIRSNGLAIDFEAKAFIRGKTIPFKEIKNTHIVSDTTGDMEIHQLFAERKNGRRVALMRDSDRWGIKELHSYIRSKTGVG